MKYGIRYVLVILLGAFIAFGFTKTGNEEVQFSGPEYRVLFEESSGVKNGKYQSWFTNGRKKAEGNYKNNNRVGLWTVWDSTGTRKVERKYTNNFIFRQVYPEINNEGPIRLWRQCTYVPKRNSAGYFEFAPLAERAVAYSKRVWRYLPFDSTSCLFRSDVLYHRIIDSLLGGTYKIYVEDNITSFSVVKTHDQVVALSDTVGKHITGFYLVEDNFFDKDRMLSETRIVGITPVVGAKGADSFPLGWIVYSRLRPLLASIPLPANEQTNNLMNLDDLFFFRSFRSVITRESNFKYTSLQEMVSKNPGTNLRDEQYRVELSMIEVEHDFWLHYSK